MCAGGGPAGNEVCEGADAVHEDPEAWEGGGGLHHAVECECHGVHQRGDVAGCFCVGKSRDQHLRKCAREDEEFDQVQKHQTHLFRGLAAICAMTKAIQL